MNTSYWTNNTSRSSDRANLLSGGSNSDSFPSSSGRKIKHDHDINTTSTFEQQNDIRLQDLSSKLSSLHKITLDIHNDVNDQVNILDDSGNSFTSLKGGLNGTIGKLKHMTSTRHKQHMCYLILFIIGIFFFLYNFWGFWSRGSESDEIEMIKDFNNNARNDV